MTIRNLEFAVRPRSLALYGASPRAGSVGRIVLDNVVAGGFAGAIWPVNPRHGEIAGRRCYRATAELPGVPDLAVIMTPPATIPGIIAELGAFGCRAAVVITAGLTRENGLRQAMLDAARPHLFRIIGPNTVGPMIPPARLNAGFAHMAASPGNIALLSQWGAIATSLIDWAAANNVGFSHIVSLGDMADVDAGDWLDLLAGDARARAIVLYLETVTHARKFMSTARAAARIKPVIALKPGRHETAARAAATHTGALPGADRVIDAALRRAGILRVGGLDELFDAAETTSRFPPLPNDRIGIVTNGGGAGVLALDQLIDSGGVPAELAPATLTALGGALPPTWSHANPVDIIGDAPAERYRAAVTAVACQIASNRDRLFACKNGSDSFLLLFCDGLMQCLRQEHRMAVRFGFASLISPELAATLQTKNIAAEIPSTCSITWITYGGDEAGIVCRLDFAHEPETATFASITHLRFDARLPLARDIAAYKKHRVKRLRRQPA